MTPEQERAEARKALESIRDEWYVWDYPHGGHEIFEKESKATILTTFPTDGNGRFDGSFIAKLPTWLRNSLDREEQLIAENERLREDSRAMLANWNAAGKRAAEFGAKVAEQDKEIQRLREALISERDEAVKWDGVGTVNRINNALNQS